MTCDFARKSGLAFYGRLAANLVSSLPYSAASHQSKLMHRTVEEYAAAHAVDVWQFEWLPYLAECLGVKPPMRAPAWLGRVLAGQLVVSLMTEARGSANEKAKQELGWAPQYASWRDGFRDWAKTAGQGCAA